ncbi:hypothetical protein [Streptomyces sp. NPDC059009]|uniref:hypothetical protein n=1 Tax=Streptomyces sp. NPDC059009 TaxID=3346694 RepID=UPI003675A265
MSTEAQRRTPVPPRPAEPPRPTEPPPSAPTTPPPPPPAASARFPEARPPLDPPVAPPRADPPAESPAESPAERRGRMFGELLSSIDESRGEPRGEPRDAFGAAAPGPRDTFGAAAPEPMTAQADHPVARPPQDPPTRRPLSPPTERPVAGEPFHRDGTPPSPSAPPIPATAPSSTASSGASTSSSRATPSGPGTSPSSATPPTAATPPPSTTPPTPTAPPPPAPSARFPDGPPTGQVPLPPRRPRAPAVPSQPSAPPEAPPDEAPEAPAPEPDFELPPPERPTRRRPVGSVDLTPGPGAGRPFVFTVRPPEYDDSTTRLRPVRGLMRPRMAAAAACIVLGLGLIGGAATGSWLTDDASGGTGRDQYAVAGELWHSVPVDKLFPTTLKGEGAGPGGADRTWTRIAVAPPSGSCKDAFDPLLRKALAPVGCLSLLRATYTDATSSHVTTVGLLFTKADADAMRSLRTRFTEEGLDARADLMPRPYAAKGTLAAGFGDAQRASWTVSVLPDAPVVAYAVSGFADGRVVTEPQSAAEAMKEGATTAPAESGLGNEAKGIADRIERGLRTTLTADTEKNSS